nr:hypothetical protein [Lentibacillus sediminis]
MAERTSGKKAKLPLYEKKEAQLGASLGELRGEVSQAPKWGVRKDAEGKNVLVSL